MAFLNLNVTNHFNNLLGYAGRNNALLAPAFDLVHINTDKEGDGVLKIIGKVVLSTLPLAAAFANLLVSGTVSLAYHAFSCYFTGYEWKKTDEIFHQYFPKVEENNDGDDDNDGKVELKPNDNNNVNGNNLESTGTEGLVDKGDQKTG